MANNCAVCGVNMDMVGRSHRCVPKSRGGSKEPNQRPGLQRPNTVLASYPDVVSGQAANRTDASPRDSTYKYRDPEKRRAYQRDYMRKKRNGQAQTTQG